MAVRSRRAAGARPERSAVPPAADAPTSTPAAAPVRSDWSVFLRVMTVAQAVLLLGVAAALTDVEAAAVGAGYLVALLLLRWRSGLLGRLLVGLLSLNVLGWMLLGAVTNLATRQGVGAVAVPALLTATSLLALAAAVVTLRPAARVGRSSVPTALGALAAVVVAAAVAVPLLRDAAPAVDADVSLVAADVRFSATEMRAAPGEVTVEVRNQDLFWHTFTIEELDVDLAVPVKGRRAVTFEAPAGTYTFFCRIPGHETLMSGTLAVRR